MKAKLNRRMFEVQVRDPHEFILGILHRAGYRRGETITVEEMTKLIQKDIVRLEQVELILQGIEKCGSKYSLGRRLGYLGVAPDAHINRVLRGEGRLPGWRIERLRLILEER